MTSDSTTSIKLTYLLALAVLMFVFKQAEVIVGLLVKPSPMAPYLLIASQSD